MCPQRKGKCGGKQELDLPEEGTSETIEVVDLEQGETCTYKVKSNCGSPAFRVLEAGKSGVNITFIEFEGSEVNRTEGGKGHGKSPKKGMPSRNSSFEDSGDQGKYMGQKKPPKRRDNGTVEDGEYIDGMDEFGDMEGEGQRGPGGGDGGRGPHGGGGGGGAGSGGSHMNKTRGGYGNPTKGEYDTEQGGYKTFGTEG